MTSRITLPSAPTEKQAYISQTDIECKRGKGLLSQYSIWNYLEDNAANTGVDLASCDATGIVMSSMTFLNTIIYFTMIMILLISLLFFCYDYIVVLNQPWKMLDVKLKNNPITDDNTKQSISPLPYEIQNTNDATTQYICGDKHQRWTDTWMEKLGTPEHHYIDISTLDRSSQSDVLDNVNCKKMYEKTKVCSIDVNNVDQSSLDGLYGIQNSTFYNAIPISKVHKRLLEIKGSPQCNTTMKLNVIDPKNNICERVDIDDVSFNQSLTIVRKIYAAIVAMTIWLLIIKMIFSNYNDTLGNNDMGWLNLFLIMYGMIVPMVLFVIFWKNPTVQYKALDSVFGTSFFRKWSSNNYAKKTRSIVLLVSMVVVFVPLVTYMSVKASTRPAPGNTDATMMAQARLSIDEWSQFFVLHKRNVNHDGYVLKSFFMVVIMGVIGVVAVQLIKLILNL